MRRPIISLLLISIISLTLPTSFAATVAVDTAATEAATTTKPSLTSLLPSTTLSLIRFDTSNIPQNLRDTLPFEVDTFNSGFTGAESAIRYTPAIFRNLILESFSIFSVGEKINESDAYGTAVKMTEETFTEALYTIPEEDWGELISNPEIPCDLQYDECYYYLDPYMIVADSYDIEAVLNALTADGPKLAGNPIYQNISEIYAPDAIMNTYFSDEFYQRNASYGFSNIFDELTENVNQAVDGAGASYTLTDQGLSAKMRSRFAADSDTIFDSIDRSANLRLHQYFPNSSPILFSDSMQTNILNSFFTEEEETMTEFGLDLNNEIIPAFTKEIAISIYDVGDPLPALTIFSDASTNPEGAQKTIDQITSLIWEAGKSESTRRYVSEDKIAFHEKDGNITTVAMEPVQIGDSTLTQFTLAHQSRTSTNKYASPILDKILNLKITIGLTDDHILLFSSDPDIAKNYGEGIKNSTIDNLLTKHPYQLNYLNFHGLASYVANFLNQIGPATSQMTEFGNALVQAFSSFDSFSHIAFFEGENNIDSEMSLVIDLSNLDKITADFEDLEKIADQLDTSGEFERLFSSVQDYKDVPTDAWFADDVYFLTSRGVLNSRDYFRPADNITRAEFVSMIVGSLNNSPQVDLSQNSDYGESQFTDTDYGDWHYNDSNFAKNLGIVKGFSDNTFHPDQTITRAEAVAILMNALDKFPTLKDSLPATSTRKYSDISSSRWYAAPVNGFAKYGLVNGDYMRRFFPLRTLTRAEAAKLVRGVFFR